MASLFEDRAGSYWRILPRQAWLAPALAETPPQEAAALQQSLDEHFEHQSRPVQLAQFDGADPAGLEESTRVFVVSDGWPGDRR